MEYIKFRDFNLKIVKVANDENSLKEFFLNKLNTAFIHNLDAWESYHYYNDNQVFLLSGYTQLKDFEVKIDVNNDLRCDLFFSRNYKSVGHATIKEESLSKTYSKVISSINRTVEGILNKERRKAIEGIKVKQDD